MSFELKREKEIKYLSTTQPVKVAIAQFDANMESQMVLVRKEMSAHSFEKLEQQVLSKFLIFLREHLLLALKIKAAFSWLASQMSPERDRDFFFQRTTIANYLESWLVTACAGLRAYEKTYEKKLQQGISFEILKSYTLGDLSNHSKPFKSLELQPKLFFEKIPHANARNVFRIRVACMYLKQTTYDRETLYNSLFKPREKTFFAVVARNSTNKKFDSAELIEKYATRPDNKQPVPTRTQKKMLFSK